MNEEVLKIINEPDQQFDSDIDLSLYDINDLLEEEEVEIEFLFPEQYEKNLRSRRNRRASTWIAASKRDMEEDGLHGFKDPLKKEGVVARAKTIELNYNDYKDVFYLKKLLSEDRQPEPSFSLSDYNFDNSTFEPIEIGTVEYKDFDPPEISINHPYMERFSQYYDLFSSKPSIPSKWTLQTALQYQKEQSPSIPEPAIEGSLTLNVLKSYQSPVRQDDSVALDMFLTIHEDSHSFLQETMKTYKTSGKGLPNALCMTDDLVIIGMSKSQLMCYPLQTNSSPTPEDPSPFMIGSPESDDGLESVLSLSVDLSGQYCAAGYSSGTIEILSLEKHLSIKSMSIHDIAVLFVRYLSSGNLLSVDYDGNVNVSSFSKKLFALTVTSTRILNGSQFGQVHDLSHISFSIAIRPEITEPGSDSSSSLDLVALTTEKSTVILSIDNTQASVLFSLPRSSCNLSEDNPRYDRKSNSVQRVTSSAWYRCNDNSFLFVRTDDTLIECWCIETQLDSSRHVQYCLKQRSLLEVSSVVCSCSFLSASCLLIVTQTDGFSLLDLTKMQLVHSIQPEGKFRLIYGNVNPRLGRAMRGAEGVSETVDQNARLYSNCVRTMSQGLAVLCFDRLIFVRESDMESRFSSSVQQGDLLNALILGSYYAKSLHSSLTEMNGVNTNQEGETRLRYYSFVNHLSSVIIRFAESQQSFSPEYVCGCCFDALTQIDRVDLLYGSVRTICERGVNGLTMEVFCRVLFSYLLAGSITMVPHSLLSSLIQSVPDMTQRYSLEQALTRIATDDLTAALTVLAENEFFLAYAALAIREKGCYSIPLGVIHSCLQSDRNMDYFCQYPQILSPTEQASHHLSAGAAGLLGFFYFLLQANVFGMTLTGASLNTLGRCANQGDCFRFLHCGSLPGEPSDKVSEPPISIYGKNDATFLLGLCFYALTVRVIADGSVTMTADSDSDDEMTRVAVENEGYRELNRITSDQIAGCLVWMITHPTELQESDLLLASYLLLVFMESHYSPEVTTEAQRHCYLFIRNHSECIRRDKIHCILENYPLVESLRSQVIHVLLDLGCLQECVQILEKVNAISDVIETLVRVARGNHSEQAWQECEQYLSRMIRTIADSNGNMNQLAEQMAPFYNLLLYWNDKKSPYYLLVVCNGDHQRVMTHLEEKACYVYLRRFLLRSTIPTLAFGTSLLEAVQMNSHISITPAVLSQFARSLLEFDRSRLGEFLQLNSISDDAAKDLLSRLNDADLESSCLLQIRVGKEENAMQRVNEEYGRVCERIISDLRSVFSVQDLERVFVNMRELANISRIFGILFDSITRSQTFTDIEETYLASAWRTLLFSVISIVSAIRRTLTMKIELNGNRKVIAGLELCEEVCGSELQHILEVLQGIIPVSILLGCVLERNANSTVKDLSGIVNKVLGTLQSDVKNYANYVRIFRGDYNSVLQEKMAELKRPVKARYGVCSVCGLSVLESDSVRVFACGHVAHESCCQHDGCEICDQQSETVKKAVRLEMLPTEAQMLSVETVPEVPDVQTRWKEWCQAKEAKERMSLVSVFQTHQRGEFMKLLEPPALFSAIPASSVSGDLCVPMAGVLPIRPEYKGDCILLPSNV